MRYVLASKLYVRLSELCKQILHRFADRAEGIRLGSRIEAQPDGGALAAEPYHLALGELMRGVNDAVAQFGGGEPALQMFNDLAVANGFEAMQIGGIPRVQEGLDLFDPAGRKHRVGALDEAPAQPPARR